MFCSSCGKKNVRGAKFCEDCGTKLVSNSKNNRKSLEKKTKRLLLAVSLMIIIFTCFFIVLSNKFKPESVAKDYFAAICEGSAEKLYNYLDVKDSDFTSKKIFKKVANLSKQDIVNYSVDNVTTDKLTSEVTIKYTEKNSKTPNSFIVSLIKNKKNKFLFFDNWEVSNKNLIVLKDVVVRAPKGSKVSFEGITLSKKYLDKEEDDYNRYVVPSMFKGNYDVIVTLKNGLSLEDSVLVNSSVNLTSLNVSKGEQSKIEKSLPKLINSIYQNAIDKKAFDDIKKDYDYDGAKLDSLKNEYNYIVTGTNYSGLTKFTVNSVKVSGTRLDGSYISVTAKLNYEYTVTKTWLGEERKNTKKLDDTIYLNFDYVNGEYKLVGISSFPKYFSLF